MKYFKKTDISHHWIQKYGFDAVNSFVTGEFCQFECPIKTPDEFHYVWLGIDFENLIIHVYVEYDCGGEIERDHIDISDWSVDNEDKFMDSLENLLSEYIERYS